MKRKPLPLSVHACVGAVLTEYGKKMACGMLVQLFSWVIVSFVLVPVPLFTISTHYIPNYKPSLWLPHAYLENDRVLVNEERPTPF